MPIQTKETKFFVQTYQWDRSAAATIDTPSNNLSEILLTIEVYQPVVPHNPQDITNKRNFVCYLSLKHVRPVLELC